MKDKLYFGAPNFMTKYHIFKDGRSLCGKWTMPFKVFNEEDLVRETNSCGMNDCKLCFKKLKELKL